MYSCNAAKREHPPPTSLYKREVHGETFVSTQFRASPFERALFSALNRVLLIN